MRPPSLAQATNKYQVLIASASAETARLLEPLQHIPYPGGEPDKGGLFRPNERMVFRQLDYSLVDAVMRSMQAEWPFAVMVVDVQPGAETKSEQIMNALYYATPSVGMVVLLAEGATLSPAMQELILHNSRMTFIQMPSTLAQIYQSLKLMLHLWSVRLDEVQVEATSMEPVVPVNGSAASAGTEHVSNLQLEVVGSLASGIAHEFNNVLTVIQSQMDMAMQQASSMPGVVDLLQQVMETARNASTLSRKLVSFDPEEEDKPEAVDLTAAVDEEVMLLSKTLGDHMRVEVKHTENLPLVWMDRSTISQLIINVALHARQAMTEGGTVEISTEAVDLQTGSKHARLFPGTSQGRYVMLTMEDPNPSDYGDSTQVVMDSSAPVQRATEDRLIWIQRTIQAAGGALNVTLLPGMVRSYQMLFPLADAPAVKAAEELAAVPATELAVGYTIPPSTVLVVDDDETICMIMSQVLGTQRHRVLIAKSADEAWNQWCQHRSSIRLLITDINMPGGANGVTLGHAIQEQDGSVPVIYTSGHRAVHQFAELEVGHNYLPKPFGMNDLLTVTNRALMSEIKHGLA